MFLIVFDLDINYQQSYMSIRLKSEIKQDEILRTKFLRGWLVVTDYCKLHVVVTLCGNFIVAIQLKGKLVEPKILFKFCKGFGGEFWSFINFALLEIHKIKFSATNFVSILFYYIVISQK